MSERIRHLNPYGYDDAEMLETFQSTIGGIGNGVTDYDKQQDLEIGKRVTIDDFNSGMTIVTNGVNENTKKISALTDDINSTIDDINIINNDQDSKISVVSASVLSIRSDVKVLSGDVGSLKEKIVNLPIVDAYTKAESDEKFVEKDLLDKLMVSADTFTKITLFNELSGKVDSNTVSIDSIESNLENSVKNITDGITINTNNLVSNIKDVQSNLDGKIERVRQTADSAKTIADTSYANTKYNRELIDTINDQLPQLIDKINNAPSASEVYQIKETVNNVQDSLKNYASQSDVDKLKSDHNDQNNRLNLIDAQKQDKGNYVSATTLNDYYKKSETSGATELENAFLDIADKLNDYLTVSGANKSYVQIGSVVDKHEYEDDRSALSGKVTNIEDAISSFNNSTNRKISGNTNDIKSINDRLSVIPSTYATREYVETSVNDLKKNMSDNSTLLKKITDSTADADYKDDGNGVLDVLHREFHKAFSGYSDNELDSVVKIISDKIDALDKKYDEFNNRVKALENKLGN